MAWLVMSDGWSVVHDQRMDPTKPVLVPVHLDGIVRFGPACIPGGISDGKGYDEECWYMYTISSRLDDELVMAAVFCGRMVPPPSLFLHSILTCL